MASPLSHTPTSPSSSVELASRFGGSSSSYTLLSPNLSSTLASPVSKPSKPSKPTSKPFPPSFSVCRFSSPSPLSPLHPQPLFLSPNGSGSRPAVRNGLGLVVRDPQHPPPCPAGMDDLALVLAVVDAEEFSVPCCGEGLAITKGEVISPVRFGSWADDVDEEEGIVGRTTGVVVDNVVDEEENVSLLGSMAGKWSPRPTFKGGRPTFDGVAVKGSIALNLVSGMCSKDPTCVSYLGTAEGIQVDVEDGSPANMVGRSCSISAMKKGHGFHNHSGGNGSSEPLFQNGEACLHNLGNILKPPVELPSFTTKEKTSHEKGERVEPFLAYPAVQATRTNAEI